MRHIGQEFGFVFAGQGQFFGFLFEFFLGYLQFLVLLVQNSLFFLELGF